MHNVEIISRVASIRDILIPGIHDGREFEKTVVFRGDVTMIYPDGTTKIFSDDRLSQEDIDATVGDFASMNGIDVTYEGAPALFFRGLDASKPVNDLATEMFNKLYGSSPRALYGNSMILKNPKRTVEYI